MLSDINLVGGNMERKDKIFIGSIIVILGAIVLGFYLVRVLRQDGPVQIEQDGLLADDIMININAIEDEAEKAEKIERMLALNKKIEVNYKRELRDLTKLGLRERSPEIKFSTTA